MDFKNLVRKAAATLALGMMGLVAFAQGHQVTGTIEDTSGEPVIGANVIVVGTQNGCLSDIDGNFRLNNVPSTAQIQVSYVGYKTETVTVGDKTHFNITLSEDSEILDEIVVVGYGTMRKKDLTGSVVQINPDKLADQNPGTVQDLLRGTPGLQIGYDASAKGGGSIQLRGKNSLGTSASPMIVLDGMAFYGELSEINPDDIAQIDVLKDASSAAIYGAQAAAGVIIITTKKGKTGKPVVTLSANLGINTKSAFKSVFGPDDYMRYREDWYKATTYGVDAEGNFGYYNNGTPAGYYDHYSKAGQFGLTTDQWAHMGTVQMGSDETLDMTYAARLNLNQAANVYKNYLAGKTVDWYDLTFRTGLNQDYNASVSGATENVNYYLSFGYLKNEGAIQGNDYHAFRSSMKINAKVTPWLEIGANANFQDRSDGDIQVSLGGNYWDANMLRNSPYASFKEEDGSYTQYPFNGNPTNGGYNYYFDRQYLDLEKGYTVLNTIFNAKVTLPYGFTYQFNIAPRLQWFYDRYFMSAEKPDASPASTGVNRNSSKSFAWSLNNTLTWDKTYADKHHITVTLVQEAEENRYWSDNISARNITPTDALGLHYISGADKEQSGFSCNDTHWTAAAYLGRVFYGFDDKYMVTASVRRDGYSAFGSNNPWANFWSLGLSWRLSQEKFLQNQQWLDDAKLRVSYGTNGNRSLGDTYLSLANLVNGGKMVYYEGTKPVDMESLAVSRLGSPNLKWERTNAWNVGLDLSALNYRIGGSIEYYYKTTKDMIMGQRLPSFSGFDKITTNLGEVTNEGVEITVNATPVLLKDFRWDTTVGFSYNKNRIRHLYYDYDPETGKENSDLTNGWYIGHAMGTIWDYKTDGIWQLNEVEEAAYYGQTPGDPKVLNLYTADDAPQFNQDGSPKLDAEGNQIYKPVYNDNDKVYQGTTAPPIYWTWRNDITLWKDLTLSFSFYSYMGHKSYWYDQMNNDNGGSWVTNCGNVFAKEYWTPENPTNKHARLDAKGPEGARGLGAKLYNRNFVRFDNISLGYTIPQKWTRKAFIEKLRVTAGIHNVCTIHHKDFDFGTDPETGGLATRTYNFGINVTL